jgi:hypothetical protein
MTLQEILKDVPADADESESWRSRVAQQLIGYVYSLFTR